MAGKLYLCATPIGNMKDITYRVVETLGKVDLIAAEDTRHSRILLDHFHITTPMTSYHEHNRYEKAEALVKKLLSGMDIALVTDAGTPGISDPGEELVRQCAEAGIEVTSLPGACACITGLTISALHNRRFRFEAFLPLDKNERREVIEELKNETRTIILYEAPHRLRKTLEELMTELGNRKLTICRELTKRYEEALVTTLEEAISYYRETEPRGEYVLVLAGRSREEIKREKEMAWEEMSMEEHLALYLSRGMDKKEAIKQLAKARGLSKREVYSCFVE